MTAECSIRTLETSKKSEYCTEKGTFAPSSPDLFVEEFRGLLTGHTFNKVPYRSGSAPPCMQGPCTAIENVRFQKNHSRSSASASSLNIIGKSGSGGQLHDDIGLCSSLNTNKNFTFPPSFASRGYWCQIDNGSSHGVDLLSSSAVCSSISKKPSGFVSIHKEDSMYERKVHQISRVLQAKDRGTPSQDMPYLSKVNYKDSRNLFNSPSSHHAQFLPVSHESGKNSASTASHDPYISPLDASSFNIPESRDISHSPSLPKEVDSDIIDQVGNEHVASPKMLDDTDNESRIAAVNISGPTVPVFVNCKEELRHLQPNQSLHEGWRTGQTRHTNSQFLSSEGDNKSSIEADPLLKGSSKMPSATSQPLLQSSGFTPPLYATVSSSDSSATSLYPNMQSLSLVSSPYSLGACALNNTLMPPFVSGYPPPYGSVPSNFRDVTNSSLNPQVYGYSHGGSFAQGVDVQCMNQNKHHGHYGISMQPLFSNSMYIQYYQQPYFDANSFTGQYNLSLFQGGRVGHHDDSSDLQNDHKSLPCSAELNIQNKSTGIVANVNPRMGNGTTCNNLETTSSTNAVLQYPFTHQLIPAWHHSSLIDNGIMGRRSEMQFSTSTNRNLNMHSAWKCPKIYRNYIGTKTHSCHEELKSERGHILEISEIAGNVVELSVDQHGRRFIQQKLEACSSEDKSSVFNEILPHASKLMTDVFGNYVIKKFFEHGSPEQRKELADKLRGKVLLLSLQMYGCRVVQKALEVIDLEHKSQLVCELDGHVLKCVLDQNGNHVIQKCIECIPVDKIRFIISSLRGQVATLSLHPYGCRVIQRVLEHSSERLNCQFLVDEILDNVDNLAQDQYGNYVVQHVLERGEPAQRTKIISRLSGCVVKMSQHKFASNVVEKCLEHADRTEKELLFQEMAGTDEGKDNLLTMMKDQFANYVVQKLLQTCSRNQRGLLLDRIKLHIHALRKYTYGKHIVARFEQIVEAHAPA